MSSNVAKRNGNYLILLFLSNYLTLKEKKVLFKIINKNIERQYFTNVRTILVSGKLLEKVLQKIDS